MESVDSEEVEEEMDQMQTCGICKEKWNTVEIRQSDDQRYDKCVENPIGKPKDRDEIAELRAVSLMYKTSVGKSQDKTQELKRGTKS